MSHFGFAKYETLTNPSFPTLRTYKELKTYRVRGSSAPRTPLTAGVTGGRTDIIKGLWALGLLVLNTLKLSSGLPQIAGVLRRLVFTETISSFISSYISFFFYSR